jgi:hypothetical protein
MARRQVLDRQRTLPMTTAQVVQSLAPGGAPLHPDVPYELDGVPLPMPAAPEKDHAWGWLVTYRDGSYLWEYEEGKWSHAFADIESQDVVRFRLIPFRAGLPVHCVALNPDAGERLIFFRRYATDQSPVNDQVTGQRQYTVVGWQRTVQGENVKTFAFFLEDGRCFLTSNENVII